MDALKSATGLTNKLQSGEEPVSGKQGKGTASQPYDQGNAEGNYFTSPPSFDQGICITSEIESSVSEF